MKTVEKAKISFGICLSLFCLGTSQANDTANTLSNNESIKVVSPRVESTQKIPNINTQEGKMGLEGFIQSAIAGKLSYEAKLRRPDNKFTLLSAQHALNNQDLFNSDTSLVSYHERLQKLKQMQKIAEHISTNYNVGLKTVEEIVLTAVIEAEKEDLPPALVLSLISVESTFRQNAKSGAGALGLTQVIPKWHPEKIAVLKDKKDFMTIQGNIQVGVAVLKQYLEKSNGNMRQALQRYNGSLGDKTQKYSSKVFAKHNDYKKFFAIN